MNTLRRILLVVYGLLLLAAVAGVGILLWNQDEQLDLTIQDFNLQILITTGDAEKYVATAILAVIGWLAVMSVIVALWPKRQSSRGALRIRQGDGGTVEVTAASIESLLRDELESLPEVRSVKPRVSLSKGSVDTYLDAQIEPSTSIAAATKLLSSTVESVLREQVGVTAIKRPTIRISYTDSAGPRGARSASLPPASPSDLRPQHQVAYATETGTVAPVARPAEAPAYNTTPDDEESPTT